MRTSRIFFAASGGRSLFAQSVQLKVSPTYADPNDTGRLTTGLRRKGVGFEATWEWYASEAGIGADLIDAPTEDGESIGYCVTRDGRESLYSNDSTLATRSLPYNRVAKSMAGSPKDLEGDRMGLLDRIVGGISLMAHFVIFYTITYEYM